MRGDRFSAPPRAGERSVGWPGDGANVLVARGAGRASAPGSPFPATRAHLHVSCRRRGADHRALPFASFRCPGFSRSSRGWESASRPRRGARGIQSNPPQVGGLGSRPDPRMTTVIPCETSWSSGCRGPAQPRRDEAPLKSGAFAFLSKPDSTPQPAQLCRCLRARAQRRLRRTARADSAILRFHDRASRATSCMVRRNPPTRAWGSSPTAPMNPIHPSGSSSSGVTERARQSSAHLRGRISSSCKSGASTSASRQQSSPPF